MYAVRTEILLDGSTKFANNSAVGGGKKMHAICLVIFFVRLRQQFAENEVGSTLILLSDQICPGRKFV